MRRYLLVFVLVAQWTGLSGAVDIVYLKSGSTLVAESHKEVQERIEVVLISGAKVFIENRDVDKILHETSPPIQLSNMEVDPAKLLPDTSDPLDWWLDAQQPVDSEAARMFLPFKEQIARGETLPLARNMADVRYARKQKIPTIEFAGFTLHLGMDMQYHDKAGLSFLHSFEKLRALEKSHNLKEIIEFIGDMRRSALDIRKEQIIADAIELRDRLDPDFDKRVYNQDGWTAEAEAPLTYTPSGGPGAH